MNAKLRVNFKSKINYIEKLPDLTLDIKTLLTEAENCNSLEWIDSFMQVKFSLMHKFNWHSVIDKMPYTKSVIESLYSNMPYNSVYYRYVKPNTCYNWHTDKMETCLHIPLISNPGCKFVYDDLAFSMPADGSVYIVNNRIPHTFVNAGKESRLHITLDIF